MRWVWRILVPAAVLAVVLALGYFGVTTRQDAEAAALLREYMAAQDKARVVGQMQTRTLVGDEWRDGRVDIVRDGTRSVLRFPGARPNIRIIDDGDELLVVDDRRKLAVAEASAEAEGRSELVLRNYRAHLEGETTVADRRARIIALRSRHRHELAKRAALDVQTNVPLRTETFDVNERLVKRTEFERVQFPEKVDPKAFEVPDGYRCIDHKSKRLAATEQPPKVGDKPARLPGYVPAGYELDAYYVRGEHPRLGSAVELRYTDGLRRFSIFERELPAGGTRPPAAGEATRAPKEGARSEPEGDVAPRETGPPPRGRGTGAGRGGPPESGEAPQGRPSARGNPPPGNGRGPGGGWRGGPPPGERPPKETPSGSQARAQGDDGTRPKPGDAQPDRRWQGRGGRWGRGRGGGPPALIGRGHHKVVRAVRGDVVAVIIGDLTEEDMSRIAESIPAD